MLKKYILLFFLLIFASHCYVSAQQKKSIAHQASVLFKILNNYHYNPIELNDQTSAEIFELFLKSLDPYRMYFTDQDITKLKTYEKKLDDAIRKESDDFLVKTTKLFKKRLIETDTLIGTLLQKPFNYFETDTLFLTRKDTLYFSKFETELPVIWKKWLKYQILYLLYTPTCSVDSTFSLSTNDLLAKEPEARNKIRIKAKRNIRKILEHPIGFENYVASLYLNAIANRFDPHTVYFTKNDQENFKSALSPEGLSYGISFKENNNGDVFIAQLTPGGPAWKSNLLHVGDILVKIKFPDINAFDLSYSSINEVESLLASSPSQQMDITVATASGQFNTVTLYKEKIKLDENLVKSYILKGNNKIGYISLPDFYSNWGNTDLSGCASDVAKEIIKLKKENIDGLILDIRFNGGGSMKEALELAGLFIDEGPLCVYSDRSGKKNIDNDYNRGCLYNGPLIVLVNGFSASASELLASILQDYNRAVIVGDKTFGKASVQIVIPLEENLNIYKNNYNDTDGENGYISFTIEKFYRVTGASHQKKGVLPDVKLPDLYFSSMFYAENNYRFALNNDSVRKRIYFKKLPQLPINELSDLSQIRIKNDTLYRKINKAYDSIGKLLEKDKMVLLNIDAFRKKEKGSFEFVYNFQNFTNRLSSSFIVVNNTFDNKKLQSDDIWKASNQLFIKNIRQDVYIDESFKIISDLISINHQ